MEIIGIKIGVMKIFGQNQRLQKIWAKKIGDMENIGQQRRDKENIGQKIEIMKNIGKKIGIMESIQIRHNYKIYRNLVKKKYQTNQRIRQF